MDPCAPRGAQPDTPSDTAAAESSEAVLAVLRAITEFAGAQRFIGAHLSTKFDLPRSSLGLLHYLLNTGPLQIGTLAQHMRVDLSVASRHVSTLVEAGIVLRSVDPLDRRARTIELSPRGVEYAHQIENSFASIVADALSQWTPTQLHESAQQMSALTRTLVDYIGPVTSPTHPKDPA